MIQVNIRLHGILRDKLPAESKGRTSLSLPAGTTIQDVLASFALQNSVISYALNEELELNVRHALQDGDHLEIFRPAAGG